MAKYKRCTTPLFSAFGLLILGGVFFSTRHKTPRHDKFKTTLNREQSNIEEHQYFIVNSTNPYVKKSLGKSIKKIQQQVLKPIHKLEQYSFDRISDLFSIKAYQKYICQDVYNSNRQAIFNDYFRPLYKFLKDEASIRISYMEGTNGRACATYDCNALSAIYSSIPGDSLLYDACLKEYKNFANLNGDKNHDTLIYNDFINNLRKVHSQVSHRLSLENLGIASVNMPNNYTKTNKVNDILLCPEFFVTKHSLTLSNVILHEMHHAISGGDDDKDEINYVKELCEKNAQTCTIEITAKDPTCFTELFNSVLDTVLY